MARLQQVYKDQVVPKLQEQFQYTNVMQVPRVKKITLNMGVGEAVADKKQIENAVRDMTAIAGQKPVVTKSRKSIAGVQNSRWLADRLQSDATRTAYVGVYGSPDLAVHPTYS